jgi:hypothetical protein
MGAVMRSQQSHGLTNRADRDADHNVLPDFAWAAAGGISVLAACALILALAVAWGGTSLGAPTPAGGTGPLWAYTRERAGLFMAGFLIVLVARTLSARAH